MTADIKRLIAPVIAMLSHDVERPSNPVLDKSYALEQLREVMELVNAKPVTGVETKDETRVLRDLLQESFDRKD